MTGENPVLTSVFDIVRGLTVRRIKGDVSTTSELFALRVISGLKPCDRLSKKFTVWFDFQPPPTHSILIISAVFFLGNTKEELGFV